MALVVCLVLGLSDENFGIVLRSNQRHCMLGSALVQNMWLNSSKVCLVAIHQALQFRHTMLIHNYLASVPTSMQYPGYTVVSGTSALGLCFQIRRDSLLHSIARS